MLVLSRKKNEAIVINKDIKVVVLGVKGDRVRLGVVAPNDVTVNRDTVQDRVDNNAATQRK